MDIVLGEVTNGDLSYFIPSFVERSVVEAVTGDRPDASSFSGAGFEKTSAFRGVQKGYKFYADGHVQKLEFHALPDSPGL